MCKLRFAFDGQQFLMGCRLHVRLVVDLMKILPVMKQRGPGASHSHSDITIVPIREIQGLMAAFPAKLAGLGVRCQP